MNKESLQAQYDVLQAKKKQITFDTNEEFARLRREAVRSRTAVVDDAIGTMIYEAKERDKIQTSTILEAIRSTNWARYKKFYEIGKRIVGDIQNVTVDWTARTITLVTYPGYTGTAPVTYEIRAISKNRIAIAEFPEDAKGDLREWMRENLSPEDAAKADELVASAEGGVFRWN